VAGTHDTLRRVTRDAFESWLDALAEDLARAGVDRGTARRLSLSTVSLLEGAFLLSRSTRTTEPMDAARDAAVALISRALSRTSAPDDQSPAPARSRAPETGIRPTPISHRVHYMTGSTSVSDATAPGGRSRAERKADTREALLRAAAVEFAARGFGGARVEEIATRAGVTTGALYAHFAGKEALFLAVYAAFAAERAREVGAVGAGAPTPTLALRAAADQWMERSDAEPWAMRLHMEFAEYARRDPHLRDDFALRVAAVRNAAARVIERHSAGRALPLPAESLAAVLRALGMGLAIERLVDPEAIPRELFGDFVEAMFEAFFRPDGPA
jgi:AcrR family transcriptional regulator